MSGESKKNIRQILVSPSKMQVLDSLAKSNNALSKEDIEEKMVTDKALIEEVLDNLKKLNVIESNQNNYYTLSSTGKDIYKSIKKTMKEISFE